MDHNALLEFQFHIDPGAKPRNLLLDERLPDPTLLRCPSLSCAAAGQGYNVHGTVRSLSNEAKLKHLKAFDKAFPGAQEPVSLVDLWFLLLCTKGNSRGAPLELQGLTWSASVIMTTQHGRQIIAAVLCCGMLYAQSSPHECLPLAFCVCFHAWQSHHGALSRLSSVPGSMMTT